MITIEIGKPNKIQPTHFSPNSGFISFPYNFEIIQYIKSLSNRVYNPKNKTWEIPQTLISKVCNDLCNFDIEISGEMVKHKPFNTNVLPKDFEFKTQPFKHQLEGVIFGLNNDSFLLGDEQGLGKALTLDTEVYTPSGVTTMGDINVGDYVIGIDGEPTQVTNVFNHKELEMYKITFSDGKYVECCEDHLWQINNYSRDLVVDTKWFISNNPFGKKRNLKWKNNYRYYIPRTKPVKFGSQEVVLDPYVLGVLLGDGCLVSGCQLSNGDSFVTNKINELLPKNHYLSKPPSLQNTVDWVVKSSSGKRNDVVRELKELNLFGCNSHTKFIPEIYKFNSPEIRLEVVRGLLDTDGYASSNNLLQYTTVSKQLASDMEFMIESLGAMAVVAEYTDKEGRLSYTITIKSDDPSLFCTLPRKKNLLRPRKFKPRRSIASVEYIGSKPGKCITVDSKDSLFLIKNFIATHNTKQAIDLALIKKKEKGFKHCLVVCGVNGNKYNWEDEIKTHSNESSWILGSRFTKRENKRREGGSRDKLDDLNNLPDDFFLITNIETMRGLSKRKGRKKIFPIADKIKQLCDDGVIGMIIFDECHKSKNPDSNQGKAMLKIKADNMIAMSGTPLMNNPLDLYFPLKWLGYESHSFYQYKNFYCKLGGFGGREVIGYKNLGNLRQIVDKIMLRRLKSEVLDLPPKVHKIEYVEMDKNQTKIYNEVKGELIENIDKIKLSNNPLAMMIRLRQATAYPGILSSNYTESAKMDRMVEVVQDAVANGSKCIIFSNWEQVTEVAKEKLAKYNPGYITGKVDTEQRMEHINRFQNDESCKVIIGTIGAMGTGLTLNAASEVIFLDSPWNRALKDQAEDRAHRIGTKGTVTVTTIVCKDTIDERIEDIVYKKGKMSDMLVDGNANKQDSKTIVNYILS